MIRARRKLARINEVWKLNLGLRKVKQETTEPNRTVVSNCAATRGLRLHRSPLIFELERLLAVYIEAEIWEVLRINKFEMYIIFCVENL